ncbi:MAG: ATP-binding protein [Allosphingosinicella sp.]
MNELRRQQPGPGLLQAAAPTPARRKYLTIVFSDLTGSTRLAGALEAEDYAQLLEELHIIYQDVVPQFGGTVVQISGDGLLAVFGYPEANEDDGRTAVMAALELHARARALDRSPGLAEPLRLHTGVHSGLVLLNEGDAVRGRFELLGSATNVASRLATAAQSDEIVVSEATLGPDRGMFQTGERQFLSLKGKDKPIAAFRVLGKASVGTRFAARERRGLSPFVGRDRELRQLGAAVERARAGTPEFVSIVGPPGVGKTRLVSELLDGFGETFRVFRGECDAHRGAEPLQPFLQILRSVLGLTRPLPSENQAEAVEAALGSFGEKLAPHRPALLRLLASVDDANGKGLVAASAATAVKALLARLIEDGPVTLFIDDWQWADDASRRMLDSLRGLERAPLLVLLTTRGEDPGAQYDLFERVTLGPLSNDETEAAIRQMLPKADPFLIGDMCAAAGGNPLFIEELCHSVAYGEQDFRTHGGSGWLDILIESRFARLPDEQTALLATASVIGNVIPAWLLEAVTGCGEDDPLMRALGEEDFIFPGERAGTLRFKHGITRDVIYDSIGLRVRREQHLRIAQALRERAALTGEEEFYEALAHHYGAGGDAAATARYAELAGDKAMERSALDRAMHHYRATLDALDKLDPASDDGRRWSRIARRFGLAAAYDPKADQLPILEKAVERARGRSDPLALALAHYWLGYILYGLGRARVAAAHCEQAMAAARIVGDEGLMDQIGVLLGQARALICDYGAALPLLDQAIAPFRERRGGYHALMGYAYSLSCKGLVLADLGRFDEARDQFREALRFVAGSEHPVEASILSNYCLICMWQGRMDEAVEIAAEAARVCARIRAFYMHARNRAAGAFARWASTRSESDVAQFVEAATWLEESGSEQLMSLIYGWLAEMMAAADQVESARHYAARAIWHARRGDRFGEAMAMRAVARAEATRKHFARAEHYLERAMAAAQRRGARHEIPINQLRAAELALARGDRATAIDLLDQAETVFAALSMDWYAGEAARLRSACT